MSLSSRTTDIPEYRVWRAMRERCMCKTNKRFKDYGGRGITVCERWLGKNGFRRFYSDMGPKPPGYTIDRIDNSGGYSPENCRWATWEENQNNRRDTIHITLGERTMPLRIWAKELGIPPRALWTRIRVLGWSIEDALNTPVGPSHRING